MFSLFIDSWMSQRLVHALSWTFIHSLWQGLIAAGFAALIIYSTRRAAARVRYNLLSSVLLLLVVSCIITFFQQWMNAPLQAGNIAVNAKNLAPSDNITITALTVSGSPGYAQQVISFCNRYAEWIVAGWLLLFTIRAARFALGINYTYRIRRQHTMLPSLRWSMRVNDLAKTIGIDQYVSLLESTLIKVPAAIGYLKPVILVPVGMLSQLTTEQAETILLHELAHLRRKDYLVNMVQNVIEALLCFNPAVVWISSLIRDEREACCDDIVLENTAAQHNYLEALVSFHEYQDAGNYAMTLGKNRMHLLERVKRMLTQENKKLSVMEKVIVLTGLLVVATFTFMPAAAEYAANRTNKKPDVRSETVAGPKHNEVPAQVSTIKSGKAKLVAKNKTSTVALPVVANPTADTVPAGTTPLRTDSIQKRSFSSVSNTQVKNDKQDEQVVEAVETNGSKYKFKKQGGKMVSFFKNDSEVPPAEWKQHQSIITAMEESVNKTRPKSLLKDRSQLMESRNFAMQQAKLEGHGVNLIVDSTRIVKMHMESINNKIRNLVKDSIRIITKHNQDLRKLEAKRQQIVVEKLQTEVASLSKTTNTDLLNDKRVRTMELSEQKKQNILLQNQANTQSFKERQREYLDRKRQLLNDRIIERQKKQVELNRQRQEKRPLPVQSVTNKTSDRKVEIRSNRVEVNRQSAERRLPPQTQKRVEPPTTPQPPATPTMP